MHGSSCNILYVQFLLTSLPLDILILALKLSSVHRTTSFIPFLPERVAFPSVCRPSVCRLSVVRLFVVCNVRVPYSAS